MLDKAICMLLLLLQVCSGMEIFEKFKVEFEQTAVEVDANDIVSPKCMQCICLVESGCNKKEGCHPDVGSDSCGPFQIKDVYWKGCGSPGANYTACTKDYTCSYKCVQKHMETYIKPSGCPADCESYARIHNGGPHGCTNPRTNPYWKRMVSKGCKPDS